MTLNNDERIAINEFVGERWAEFINAAKNYLSEQEIETLGQRLEGE